MITARRTRLVRVPDLHTFRRAIAELVAPADEPSQPTAPSPLVIVPTAGAGRQLERTLGPDRAATVLTRDELYDWLHARLPGAARRLSPLERDSLAQAAARQAAQALAVAGPADTGADGIWPVPEEEREGANDDPPRDDETRAAPFHLRPGLVSEMLRFYDQLRRQSQRLERFQELVEETLGGGAGDRGTDRLLSQTRLLRETFRAYERRAAQSGAWDEHTLRERLMQTPLVPALRHVIVTIADWIAEPDGLYVGDFDLLARMPGLERIDLVCTEQLLGSEFHERLHNWWPGIEEVNAVDLLRSQERQRPVLETPRDGTDQLWFTVRDREEELLAVAQHIKASRRGAASVHAAPYERTAIVFKRPLPYLYLAAATLGAAGIPYEAADALPLAGEPFVATIDLVIAAAESAFARDTLIALLRSPHWQAAQPEPSPDAVRALDVALRERAYIGELARLEALATGWPDETSKPALDAALSVARALAPLLEPAAASVQLRRVIAVVQERLRPLADDDPCARREAGARAVTLNLLNDLADAHQAHHDPVWTVRDVGGSIRRWIEEHTFADADARAGVQLLDDRAVRYGSFDDMTIVGLVETDWPERQARNIFYPSGLLQALGWPSEHSRRRAADARFLDLLTSATRRVAVSTITLDDEAVVMRSMQLDEIPRARLTTSPTADQPARILPDDALSMEPINLDVIDPPARDWAELRVRRPAVTDPRYHGTVGPRAPQPWSVSALESYLACPFKFFAQHVLRLEDEPEDSDVMNPRQQGLFVHTVFEVFFSTWRRSGHGAITPQNLDAARAVFTAVVEDQLGALPEAEAGLERTRLLGSSAAAGLGEAVMRMEAERPVRVVERLLEHRLDGPVTIETAAGPRVIALRGKADRIDLLEDGTFRLVDYKLGWPPQRSRALQLPIYAIAARQRLQDEQGKTWQLGEAVYLAFKGPKRVVPLFGQQSDRDTVLGDAQQRVADTLDAIERGEFPPRPEDVFLCEHCGYASVCRKDYVDG